MLSSTSSFEAARKGRGATAIARLLRTSVIVLLLLGLASEWLLRTQVDPQDTLQSHLALLDRTQSDRAAFGDSHVARGFDAQQGFVNLAYPSENIEDMIAKVNMLHQSRSFSRVIVQADPHLFAPYRLNAQTKTYATNAGSPHGLRIMIPRYRAQLVAYWQAFIAGGGQLESQVRMTQAGSLLSGGDLSQDGLRQRQMDARARMITHRPADPPRIAAAQQRYSDLLNTLIARGTRVCLVSFPVSQAYRTAASAGGGPGGDALHAALIRYFAAEANRTGARYVDARGMVTRTALFRDVDHLNADGAAAFSPALLQRCFGDTQG
ncbi:hypothetical protein [Sulfitobacter sabulilitoris]|uniref:Uncharacterized protein n=1 Tax=Sulfitobacter sabulilitoris TaxID=2562655 RepID=A0A5S3PLI5_9RHOB|nr:hypothetical protein [Sulfitobacter sabulilitoris]TMM55191.1 hypothetical protein FDT80_06415 [Sulfitobacter sabulilitoris]